MKMSSGSGNVEPTKGSRPTFTVTSNMSTFEFFPRTIIYCSMTPIKARPAPDRPIASGSTMVLGQASLAEGWCRGSVPNMIFQRLACRDAKNTPTELRLKTTENRGTAKNAVLQGSSYWNFISFGKGRSRSRSDGNTLGSRKGQSRD